MSVETHVSRAAALMADAESAILDVQSALLKLPEVFASIHGSGVEGLGYLETAETSAEAKALAGVAADLEAGIFKFHRDLTKRAQELGIDLPQTRSGVR